MPTSLPLPSAATTGMISMSLMRNSALAASNASVSLTLRGESRMKLRSGVLKGKPRPSALNSSRRLQ